MKKRALRSVIVDENGRCGVQLSMKKGFETIMSATVSGLSRRVRQLGAGVPRKGFIGLVRP